jgi:hypothetical protein
MAIVTENHETELEGNPVVVAPAKSSSLGSDLEQPSDTEKNTNLLEREEQNATHDRNGAMDTPLSYRLKEVFLNFAPLGLVAFGGPTAHVAILHERFVESKKWLDDEKFIELLAVGQGLPGPTSTQMVIATGMQRLHSDTKVSFNLLAT